MSARQGSLKSGLQSPGGTDMLIRELLTGIWGAAGTTQWSLSLSLDSADYFPSSNPT